MNNPQIPEPSTHNLSISLPSATALANLRQTSREMAQFNRELAEIEAQLDSPKRCSANENYTPKN